MEECKTVRVRVAVAWNPVEREFSACGWSVLGDTDYDEMMMDQARAPNTRRFVPMGYIVAEMETPPAPWEPQEVAGDVDYPKPVDPS